MMPGFLTLWPLALRRLRARWRMLLPLVVGSILAAALLSSTVIYGDAVRELGLNHALRQEPSQDLDINMRAYYHAPEPGAYETIRNEMEVVITRNVEWFVDDVATAMKGSTFFVNQVAERGSAIEPSPENIEGTEAVRVDPRLRAVFLARPEFDDKTSLVAGERSATVVVESDAQGVPTSSPVISVTVLEETAQRQGLEVGDSLLLVPYWEDVSQYNVVRVGGIVRPIDPLDRYWLTRIARQTAETQEENFIPLYISEETFLTGLGRLFPKMLSDYAWALFVDPSKIDARNAELAKFGLTRMENQLQSRIRVFLATTALDSVLEDFGTRELFGRIPLLIVVLMIVGIIFYFLVMVASAVVDRDLGEMALLGSRGADSPQVLTLYLWEALAMVVVAVVVGPLLALGATSLMGHAPAFSNLSGGGTLEVRLTVPAVLMAAAGAGIAFVALLLPTLRGLSLNPLRHKASSARPESTSLLNRYYVDIFVGIIAGLLYWELTQRGSVVTTTLLGQSSADEALLAAPALFLLAVALLFLRFFPLIARAAGWMASWFGKAWLVLGMWQIGRNPLQYTGVILLLMLASSVAMFAANFGATVDRSYEERALYSAGGEIRVVGSTVGNRGPSVSFIEQYDDIPGAELASPAYRRRASVAGLFFGQSFELLAVEPSTFGRAAWYRSDFSQHSLDGLTEVLESDAPPALHGLLLPEGATTLGVWALPTNPRRDLVLRARVADSNGRYKDYELGALDSAEWSFMEADLVPAPSRFQSLVLAPPLRLVSLNIRQRTGDNLSPGALYLDDLQVGFPSSGPVVFEPFDDLGSATVIRDSPQSRADSLETSASIVRDGRGSSAVFIWGTGSIFGIRGFSLGNTGEPQAPFRAIASRSLLESEGASRGDRLAIAVAGHTLPVEIAEVVDFFPRWTPTMAASWW